MIPKISIVIPTLATEKSLPYLKLCVESIRRNSTVDHDILVMVNGGNMQNIKIPARVYYIEDQGQCIAVNTMAKQVETEWMIVTDDDSIFPPRWERIFENTDKSDILCMNSMESGKVGSAPPFVVNNCGLDDKDFDVEKFEADALRIGSDEGTKEGHLEKGFSFPFLIKKSLWDKVGGYDTAYDPWGSNCDSDFFYKMKLAGEQPLRDRRILAYHFSQISGTFDFADTDEGRLHYARWEGNKRYFREKWGFERIGSPEIWYDFEIPFDQLKYTPIWQKR